MKKYKNKDGIELNYTQRNNVHTDLVKEVISEIDFKFPVIRGDVVEIGMQTLEIGKTSCTLACDVRSLQAGKTVCSIAKMVYVRVNKYGLPKAHGGM